MTVLIELKEKLKEFYGSCSGIVLPIVKFLLALAVFRGINSNLGYLKMLNSMYVVLILSLICAILPLNGMVFLAMLVIIGHCFALHMVIAGLAALVLLVLWFLYLRFVPKDAPALLLTPLAFWLHVPSAVPVAYGLAGTPLSAFSAACGVVVYYMCDMIHGKMEPLLHAAEAPEITAVVQEFFNELHEQYEQMCQLTGKEATRLTGSGNGIRRNSLMRRLAEEMFKMPMEMNMPRHTTMTKMFSCSIRKWSQSFLQTVRSARKRLQRSKSPWMRHLARNRLQPRM